MKKRNRTLISVLFCLMLCVVVFFFTKPNIPNRNKNAAKDIINKKSQRSHPNQNSNATKNIIKPQKKQADTTVANSEINLHFIDESTGFAITPEHIEFNRRNEQSLGSTAKIYMGKNGAISKQLTNGIYDIIVSSRGYKPIQTFFELRDETINVSFNLAPIDPPQELSVARIQSLHRADAMVIVGTVIDNESGKPLPGVEILSKDKLADCQSDKNGFFSFILPLPNNSNQLKDRSIVFFRKKKYITEIRENFDMWPNGDAIVKIEMKKGEGMNRVMVIQNRPAVQTIL